MRAIVNLILRVANLAEAEGRLARQRAFEFAVAFLLLWAATTLLVVGLFVAGAALALGMAQIMHPSLAMAIVAAMLLIMAAFLAMFVRLGLNERWTRK